MITGLNLSMRFGGKILFNNVNFQLNPGQHYGLVGANGSGKSTLIKILTGELTPEKGDVSIPSLVNVGTLKQDQFRYDLVPIVDTVLMGKTKLWQALQKKHELLQKENFTEEECHTLADLEKVISTHQGYSAESEAARLLEGLGLPNTVHRHQMHTLSGGFKLRVLLAQVLFSHPDILLLDEPTNHLDLFSIKWLEEYLKDFPGTLMISSHDRDFLNGVCNNILDLDHQTVKIYKGNFDVFVETKASDLLLRENILDKQEKKREDIQVFIDRFKAKASKARQAQSKMRMVEKLVDEMDELNLGPSCRMYPKLHFDIYRPSGAIALKVKSISKSYGEKEVLKDISFEIERGDRVALLGANGIGKSTLLEILSQNLQPGSGTFEWGHAAQHAYFPQDHAREVKGSSTLLEWLCQFDRQMNEEQFRQILAKVLFSGDDVKKPIDILSGGETARLILAKMMVQKHNILIFDEPTNHLDMEAIEALLEALHNYPGTILFVSHNRHFVSSVATRVIEMTKEGIMDFRCNYQEYLSKREIDLLSSNLSLRQPDSQKSSNVAQKNKYQEQKNQRNLKSQLAKKVSAAEEKCHEYEEEIKKIEMQLASPDFYQKNNTETQKSILAKKNLLEKMLEETLQDWEEMGIQMESL